MIIKIIFFEGKMYKNLFSIQRKKIVSHGGKGNIEFARIFSRWDTASSFDFVDYAVLPPGTSIGFHRHTDNEEIYLILKGTGKMCLDGESFYVSQGDIIVNRNLSSHGLENQSNEEIHIYVVQARCRKPEEIKEIRSSVGIDIGGTNTKVVLLQNDHIKAFWQFSTPYFCKNGDLVDFIASCVQRTKDIDKQIYSVGIGISGIINADTGYLVSSCLMPKICNINLRESVSDRVKLPVYIDNDSNMAALGEWYLGSAKGCLNSITLTLGTGIGAGIIINGMLYRGSSGKAGEIGHIIAQSNGEMCPCGKRGCLNMYTSATALTNNYMKKSGISRSVMDIIKLLKSDLVDKTAESAFSELCDCLSKIIVDLICLFDCEAIVITAGLSKMGNMLIEQLKLKVKEKIMPGLWRDDCIRLGELAEKAGAVGAAIQANYGVVE